MKYGPSIWLGVGSSPSSHGGVSGTSVGEVSEEFEVANVRARAGAPVMTTGTAAPAASAARSTVLRLISGECGGFVSLSIPAPCGGPSDRQRN